MTAPRPHRPEPSRRGDLRAFAGLVVAGLVLGGAATLLLRTAGEWMEPGAAQAASPEGSSTARRAVDRAVAAKAASEQAAAEKNAAAGVASPVPAPPAAAGATSPAATSPAAAPTPGPAAARPGGVQTLPQMDEQVTFQYNALGRRDPFLPLIGGVYIGQGVGGAPPDVGGIKVVGIVWGAQDRFALVEDASGNSMVLRHGDKVMNGVVAALQREAVVVKLTVDGQSESVTIPLTRKGDQSHENR